MIGQGKGHHGGRGHWIERHAGYCIAVPSVALALVAMAAIRVAPTAPRPEPVPPRILIEIPPPPEEIPVPREEIPTPIDPMPVDIAATRPNSDETGEDIADPMVGESASDAPRAETAATASLVEWVPTTDDAAEIRALREAIRREAEALESRSRELQQSIVREEVKSAARDFQLSSDGATRGAIRLLDTSGHPESVVEPILKRYGMTFERRYTRPVGGRGFLNAAQTERGTYANMEAEGYYDVLTLSNKALATLAVREAEALAARGFDARTTRVIKIVFGIRKMDCKDCPEYDLGVINLEVEQIR